MPPVICSACTVELERTTIASPCLTEQCSCTICGLALSSNTNCAKGHGIAERIVSPSDWTSMQLIVNYFGGRANNLHWEDGSVEELIQARGLPSIRLSSHHFPVYLWESDHGRRHSRMMAIIDQGQYRFGFHFDKSRPRRHD